MAVKVRINPHLSIASLQRGAVHEMFHALEQPSHGVLGGLREEMRVTRRTRSFMEHHVNDLIDGMHAATVAVQKELGREIQPEMNGAILHNLLTALHLTRIEDERAQAELAERRRGFLGTSA
jgi:hypothetical protein